MCGCEVCHVSCLMRTLPLASFFHRVSVILAWRGVRGRDGGRLIAKRTYHLNLYTFISNIPMSGILWGPVTSIPYLSGTVPGIQCTIGWYELTIDQRSIAPRTKL